MRCAHPEGRGLKSEAVDAQITFHSLKSHSAHRISAGLLCAGINAAVDCVRTRYLQPAIAISGGVTVVQKGPHLPAATIVGSCSNTLLSGSMAYTDVHCHHHRSAPHV